MTEKEDKNAAPVQPIVSHRKPKDLMTLCFGTYLWTTDSGNVRIEIPEVLTLAELGEIETLFGIIVRRLKRNVDG